jgi:hypothetical protein
VRSRVAITVASLLACIHARQVESAGSSEKTGSSAKAETGNSPQATSTRIPPREGRPTVAATPEDAMNPGSSKEIQEALKRKGYLKEDVTGHLDEATSAGLRKFQHDKGLPETGAPDRETLRGLGVNPQTVYRTVPEGNEAQPKD